MKRFSNNILYTLILLIAFFAFNISVNAVACDITTTGDGSYTSNSGASYKTHAYHANCGGNQYVALCIDPGKQYKRSGSGWNFQALSGSSEFGRYASALYAVFQEEGKCSNGSDTSCILRYQNAIRKMIFSTPSLSAYQRGSTAGLAVVYKDYQNGNIKDIGDGALISKAQSKLGSGTGDTVNARIQKGSFGFELVVDGTNVAPSQIDYTLSNGASGSIPTNGNLVGNTYTVQLPTSIYNQVTKCEEITTVIKYRNINGNTPGNLNGATGIAAPGKNTDSGNDGIRNIQQYLLFPLDGSDGTVTAVGNIGPKGTIDRSDGSSIIDGGSDKYGYESYEICDYVCREGDEECPPDEPPVCEFNATIGCMEPASYDNTDHKVMTVNEGSFDGTGETDWETCIIHNKDRQGENAYPYDISIGEVTAQRFKYLYNGNWITAQDAKFCSLSCKEKYEFDMPASKANVGVGTFFSFNITNSGAGDDLYHSVVGVKGEKQCVTSGPGNSKTSRSKGIDINGFKTRVISLRQQQVDYINAYYYNKALSDKIEDIRDSFVKGILTYGLRTEPKSTNDGNPPNYLNDFRIADGFNYDNWLRYDTKYYDSNDSIFTTFGGSDTLDVNVYNITQCRIANANDVTSDISCYQTGSGNLNRSFRGASTVGYLVNSFINSYEGAYDDAYVFDVIPTIYINSTNDTHTYTYSYTENVINEDIDLATGYSSNNSGSPGSGEATAYANYQTNEQREEALNDLKDRFDKAAQAALKKAYSLGQIIEQQNRGMSLCYIQDNNELNIDNYEINPELTFEYAEEDYKADTTNLEMINSKDSVSAEYNYCSAGYSGNAAGVFNCHDGSGSANVVRYLDVDFSGNTHLNDRYKFYDVSRVGVTVKFQCNGSFCYYGNPATFYTYPPDGIAVPYEHVNSTIIEHDGHVYPISIKTPEGKYPYRIKFEGIGQYFESGDTGRLMGSSNAVMTGDYGNEAVCTYEVKHPKSPDCDPEIEDCDKRKVCQDRYNEYCINPDTGEYYKPLNNESEAIRCVQEMLSLDCCTELNAISEGNAMPAAMDDEYNKACGPAEACVGFDVVTSSTGLSYADSAIVSGDFNTNGALRFSVRTVSLNNLFPNGDSTRGLNWNENYIRNTKNGVYGTRGLQISDIINHIESEGEAIYGGEPDYSIIMTPECTRNLREHNKDYDGGYIAYNLEIVDESSYIPGSKADNSDFFEELRRYGCEVNKVKDAEGINTGHLKD